MDIRIRIVPNPLYGTPGSLVENAYKGEVIHTGTVTAADICEACKQENPQMTEPLASLATETIMDYGSDRVVTDVVRFNLGSAYFTMEPAVSGSVPTVDAALSDANERYIRVVNGPSLNARIAALRPVITGDDLGDVQFHSTETVRDDGEFKNTLFGDEEFVALGKRLGGADQRMELVAADGTTVSAATFLGGDALGQRFRYRLATPPAESGAYTLVLTSTGKDTPDASPKSIPVKVAYVAPAFTLVAPEKVPFNGDGWDLHGTNLGGFDKEAQSIVVRFDCKDEVGGSRGETYWDAESVEDGVIHVEGMVDAAAKTGGDCEIVVTIGDETHSVHSVVSDAPDIPPEP